MITHLLAGRVVQEHHVDWAAVTWSLPVALVALGGIAFHFSRRTFRAVVLVTAAIVIVGVTGFGLALHGYPMNYASLSVAGRVGLLIVLGGVLAGLDTWSARREQPRVTVPKAPKREPGQPDLDDRRTLTEKLRFKLPAVDVRRPATMPGSTAVGSLASLTEASDIKGSGIAAALLQLAQALQGHPCTYEVRMFTERPQGRGGPLRITVEVRDARTGRSIAVEVLQPCVEGEAAEMVAGYVAQQVFRNDPSTPPWAAGSTDGEDLSAYLLAREIRPTAGTNGAWQDCRKEQREKLERVARSHASAAGVVGYELAGIHDLDQQYMQSLLLHLRNRVSYPGFWRGRYRLAISLSMLARLDDKEFKSQWLGTACPASASDPLRLRDSVIRELSLADLLRHLNCAELSALCDGYPAAEKKGKPKPAALLLRPTRWKSSACRWAARTCAPFLTAFSHQPDPGTSLVRTKLAMLHLARREFRACWWHRHALVLLWTAFWSRRRRSTSLAALSGKPWWWRHPRRRLWPVEFALEIVKQRMRQLDPGAYEDLRKAQRRVRRKLRLSEAPCNALGTKARRIAFRKNPRWVYQRAPWQAVYNAACLHALPESSACDKPAQEAADYAVRLLRLAISDPDCELDRPSEWIGADPGLQSLQDFPVFTQFIREQRTWDFER